jgi:hypothetical protein
MKGWLVNDELERKRSWPSFKVLSQHLPWETEEEQKLRTAALRTEIWTHDVKCEAGVSTTLDTTFCDGRQSSTYGSSVRSVSKGPGQRPDDQDRIPPHTSVPRPAVRPALFFHLTGNSLKGVGGGATTEWSLSFHQVPRWVELRLSYQKYPQNVILRQRTVFFHLRTNWRKA